MIFLQHLADDTGGLAERTVRLQPHLIHRVEDAAMHRLQTVAHVGQRATDDHAHRIIQIGAGHLIDDTNRFDDTKLHRFRNPSMWSMYGCGRGDQARIWRIPYSHARASMRKSTRMSTRTQSFYYTISHDPRRLASGIAAHSGEG